MPVAGFPSRTTIIIARAGFGVVVLAAAVSGFALMIFPDSTRQFFSWGLEPPALASLIGGLYLASAVTFGVALPLPWPDVRPLLAASVALTAPTLVFTFVHLDVFELSRWQAWAWVALFSAAPPFWAGLLWARRGEPFDPARTAGVGPSAIFAVAVVLAVGAVVMWADPRALWGPVPFELAGLGGRFIGAWLGFLAVMAAWFGVRHDERLIPSVALAAYPAGALLAGLRSFGDLGSTTARAAYLGVLASLTIVFTFATFRVGRRVD